jgi:murein L,D-transpeptidase YcbB/YkuD
LFDEAERNLSNGCVRLEDAQRLARWLLGRNPVLRSDEPEQHVSLAAPVPIVITYLDRGSQMQLASLR